ncbi:WD40-repeat-containing domain protein, partial [Radiomyces spectabilis]|uniref:WD40-repeat-containing domain protein n=1 Tax=Radiomyces spectabilis TaxID=64574 RepID=UPI00221FB97E
EVYQYDAPWPIYAMDWSKVPTEKQGFRLALGSFLEEHTNKVSFGVRRDYYDPSKPRSDFTPLAEVDCYYPLTKVLWEPQRGARESDILVTSSDVLRLWELVDNPNYTFDNTIGSRRIPSDQQPQSLIKRSELVNVKQSDFCAPLTSFDWNMADPSLIVTASIDTTCTVWNVETCQAKTQLIAHDRDVYDVAFKHGTADIFASVGADGSVRLFDLRSLEHSTILYEAPPAAVSPSLGTGHFASAISEGAQPLLRLQFNQLNHDLLATFHMDSDVVQILDIRYPSTPVVELARSHQKSINCFSWSPRHPGHICTGGDDSQVLVWDLNQKIVQGPVLRYLADYEINSLTWSQSLPSWIAIGFGRTVQALR